MTYTAGLSSTLREHIRKRLWLPDNSLLTFERAELSFWPVKEAGLEELTDSVGDTSTGGLAG